MPKAKRTSISKKARFEVFKRDSFTCQYCGDEAPRVVLHVDHINPVANGGGNDIANLITSCAPCNFGKGAREISDDSAVRRQKAQLDELNIRREQLEMMSSWRAGLKGLEELEVDEVVSLLDDHFRPVRLNDAGRKIVARLVKKHGLKTMLSAVDKTCEINLRYGPEGDPTSESCEKALENLGKAVRILKDPPHLHKSRYINGIARNRVRLTWAEQKRFINCLCALHDAGADLDEIQVSILDVETQEGLVSTLREFDVEGVLAWEE
jgi:hypothetical protein